MTEEVLFLQPITIAEAKEFVSRHHRHHGAPPGAKFAIGLTNGERVIGVILVGRPVARMLDNGWTAEVTRCCVLEGNPNGCSMLYSAAWRAARAMGYQRLVTYTLESEDGASLRASNFRLVGQAGGGSWDRNDRPRVDKHPTGQKLLWEQEARQ